MKVGLWNGGALLSPKEFACKCGECGDASGLNMRMSTIGKLAKMRDAAGFPFIIRSGWRCPGHEVELKKPEPGTHGLGYAVDIQAFEKGQRDWLMNNAAKFGFHGTGRGNTFVHLDDLGYDSRVPRPASWRYS